MPLLLVCVVLFFAVAQLYQWSSDLTLPFPVLLLAGAGLAVVSNLKERRSLELSTQDIRAVSIPGQAIPGQAVTSQPAPPAVLPPDIRPAVEPRPVADPQLPTFAPPAVPQPQKSISFTLNQSDRPITQTPQKKIADAD